MFTGTAGAPSSAAAAVLDSSTMMMRMHQSSKGSSYTSSTHNNSNSATSVPAPMIVSSAHQDFIHNLAFDTYGRRMATCSVDRLVKVWDLQDDGEWALSGSWQAHRGSVSSLCWAHPEFGTLLATAGLDQEAKIWEERSSIVTTTGSSSGITTAGSTSASTAIHHRWTVRASLTEARRAVTCIEFAPRHWGLKLAVASADGAVRIYEAVDIMNLSQWPLAATIQAFDDDCTSLSWCTARFEPPTLVAGGGSSHSLVVYRYGEAARAWQPLLQLDGGGSHNPSGGLPPSSVPSVPMQVLCTAWSPNVGRRFHYVAAAQGESLRVYKLLRTTSSPTTASAATTATTTLSSLPSSQGLELVSTQTIPVNAWRCQWNVTGTVLACSGDGGVVHLFKANLDGAFQCVSKLVVGGGSGVAEPSPSSPQPRP